MNGKGSAEHGILENRKRKPIVQFRKFDDKNQPTSKRPLAQDIPEYAEYEICPRKPTFPRAASKQRTV
jgi:hypothetical protein